MIGLAVKKHEYERSRLCGSFSTSLDRYELKNVFNDIWSGIAIADRTAHAVASPHPT
jgi:hypothetical protein